ncbi:chemotaxis protein CheB [Paludibacterium purpuratum]|uniref:protein-glutamate O-methyltransferase n=1 Tax=Paludibacterium purpuratum TaxID=1144873 RepID=A0A4R7B4X1_9NEIS|nr:chemotaxis protein CheB [Paludibacterium purpuratum]TDR79648.1 two-component system CheB/CheR fusion protein [Paludibacterium purpuratum]
MSPKNSAADEGTPPPVTTVSVPEISSRSFSVVGIGASAGGLEAFEQFFQHIRADSGMAFVLVPHLDPDHASILGDILQRITPIPVIEASDQIKIAPNKVYIIPPNYGMTLFNGRLQLHEQDLPRGQRMPIDVFLRSLADDCGDRAIGIVLSGTGTDGTQGLRAILGGGGITLVQQPDTAKFDGMPISAIRAGYATWVLPVAQMTEVLQGDTRLLASPSEMPSLPSRLSSINRILLKLRQITGHDFSQYKKSTIGRRIERRMSQNNIGDIDLYAQYLKGHPAEQQALFKELLVNVTKFFRDDEAFALLKSDILPLLCVGKPEDYVFRAWVAGCATGEEAFSIAMLLREYMDDTLSEFKVLLYATDIDEDVINIARAGFYPPNIAQDVSPERLRRFFSKADGGYRMKKDIREMVVFAVQNVIKDPPFTKLDLLSCRNLMIYMEPELQSQVIPFFHYALKPGGVLFLSPSESVGNHPQLFATHNRKWKFYRAIDLHPSPRLAMSHDLAWLGGDNHAGSEAIVKKPKRTDFAILAQRTLLHFFVPASVITDRKGNILYVHGDTGRYLRPAPGPASLNVVDMARDGLSLELRSAIQSAGTGSAAVGRDVTVMTNGGLLRVSLSVRPLANLANGGLLLVSFLDVESPPAKKSVRSRKATGPAELQRIDELERNLADTKENLQATIEAQQASNEELKSANEEMQSTNEELQSTNEELETSKEELQSVNEELITVNAELQAKIEQLAGMQNDMKNLLDNISVGTVFLDSALLIRRFTREAQDIYRLVASDVGRPLIDIKSDIDSELVLADARTVLATLIPSERELRTEAGVFYLLRTKPYRTLDNVIDGVVLTFTDISQRIADEIEVRKARDLAEGIVDTIREPLLVLDAKFHVVTASRSFYDHFEVTLQQTVGRLIYDLGNRQWNIPALSELLETVLPRDRSFEGYIVDHDFPTIGHRRIELNGRRIVGPAGETELILLSMNDITGLDENE